MRTTFILLSLFVLFSCHSGTEKEKVLTKSQKDSITQHEASLMKFKQDSIAMVIVRNSNKTNDNENYEEPEVKPKKIKHDFFETKDTSISEPFSKEKALKLLFPGNFYKFPLPVDSTETIILEAWSCPVCPRQKCIRDWDEPDSNGVFPLRDSNQTMYGTLLRFKDDSGRKNVIISFGSTEYMTGFIPCGRTTCAALGLALFTEENNKWDLKAFTPNLGCFGSFQTIPNIHLIKYGKNNYGCFVSDCCGAAGGPYYCDASFFGVINKKFKLVLRRVRSGRIFAFSEWDFRNKLLPLPDSTGFSGLQLITSGDYSTDGGYNSDEGDTISNVPDAIKSIIKKKDNFDFTIVSSYKFEEGAYKLLNETVTTRKLDTSKVYHHW